MTLDSLAAVLPKAAEPIVLPVPPGAVKVLPRWAEEDEVSKWRLKYRAGAAPEESEGWVELELRHFTRELPLSNLDWGLEHLFQVAIETPDGWSDWSPPVHCQPPCPQAPGKPAAVLPVVVSSEAVRLQWTPPLDVATAVSELQVTRYKILVNWMADEAMCREILVEDSDSHLVTGLESLTDYTFQVAAENAAGWSEFSEPSEVVQVKPPVPGTLNQPTLRRATHHSVVIQWQHPPLSGVPVDYFCFRHTTSTDWKADVVELRDVPPLLSQYVITGLRPGQVYTFQVRAVNCFGMGIWSESSAPIRTTDGAIPDKIQELRASDVYQSFIRLKWAPVEENGFPITGYLLRYAHSEDMQDPTEATPSVVRDKGFDTCDLRHLRKLKYFFQAAAMNRMGMAEWSEPVVVDMART